MRRYLCLIIMVLLLVGCGGGERVRAVYHWKTTFNPTEYELQWLRDHKVQRMYLRLFDVDVYDGEVGGEGPEVLSFIFSYGLASFHIAYCITLPRKNQRLLLGCAFALRVGTPLR